MDCCIECSKASSLFCEFRRRNFLCISFGLITMKYKMKYSEWTKESLIYWFIDSQQVSSVLNKLDQRGSNMWVNVYTVSAITGKKSIITHSVLQFFNNEKCTCLQKKKITCTNICKKVLPSYLTYLNYHPRQDVYLVIVVWQ